MTHGSVKNLRHGRWDRDDLFACRRKTVGNVKMVKTGFKISALGAVASQRNPWTKPRTLVSYAKLPTTFVGIGPYGKSRVNVFVYKSPDSYLSGHWRKSMLKFTLAGAGVSLFGFAAAAQAAPLLFNLNPNVSMTGTGTATVADFEAAGLPASLATGATDGQVLYQDADHTGSAPYTGSPASGIIVNGGNFSYNGGGNVPSAPSGAAAAVYQEVLLANPGGTQNTSISGLSTSSSYGLAANGNYDLYLFPVSAINNDNLNIDFTYGSESYSVTNVPSSSPVVFAFSTWASVTDSLSFSETDYNYPEFVGDRSYPGFASFAIVQVPEPACFALMTIVTAGVMLRRGRAWGK
jgi:hypothetical protein